MGYHLKKILGGRPSVARYELFCKCERSHGNIDLLVVGAYDTSGPAVIKLFESENELECKNHLCDSIEFSNI